LTEALTQLNLAMQQPIVIGVYNDSMEISDQHIVKACVRTKDALESVVNQMHKILLLLGSPISSVN
jgi:hypothetical protein